MADLRALNGLSLRAHVTFRREVAMGSSRGESGYDAEAIGESLVAYGAPLLGWAPRASLSRERALVGALALAREDATVFRLLPVFVVRNALQLNWAEVRTLCGERGLTRELGLVLELTSEVAPVPGLSRVCGTLEASIPSEPEYFFQPRSRFDRELAQRETPSVARRWGFLMNMPVETIRQAFEKHGDEALRPT